MLHLWLCISSYTFQYTIWRVIQRLCETDMYSADELETFTRQDIQSRFSHALVSQAGPTSAFEKELHITSLVPSHSAVFCYTRHYIIF